MGDHISKAEITKDTVQSVVDVTAGTVNDVTTIIISAIRDVAKSVGSFGTELFEIRDAARRASEQD